MLHAGTMKLVTILTVGCAFLGVGSCESIVISHSRTRYSCHRTSAIHTNCLGGLT
jgi:hypothetical protein